MKKISIALLALATAGLAASCQKEAQQDIKPFEPMTINAVSEGIGTATRTEMAYKYDILWSEADKIYVTDGTSNDTFTLSDGEGTTKGTFTQDGTASFTNEVQAYYPATVIQGGGLVWPATQTSSQTVPMYSTKIVCGSVEEFNFSSLGAVLQIVFTTPQANVTLQSIKIQDDVETMSGSFTVDEEGKANITATDKAGITLNLGDGINVSNKIAYFNISVPAGNYQHLTLTFTATNGAKCVMTGGKININRNTVGRLTLTGKTFKPDVPADVLDGVFKVSPTKKVQFTKGNLYYDGSALNFEANQYTYNNSYESSHVSHFTWSSTAETAAGEGFIGDNLFCDESHKVAVNGSEAIYYALSEDEWKYLFRVHDNKWATVNGVNGYVIAPYNFGGILADSYADDEALADDNLIFLPAAGDRNSGRISSAGSTCLYWSSSADGKYLAYYVYIDSRYNDFNVSRSRYDGCSIRLITDSK